jgi:alkanesulfonate monooxygenase SsuD/methylene tetrahydromethanopterin reductase-like flavin-dependent oxidoreductase (luciferase family)
MEFGVFQGASMGPRPWAFTEAERIRRDIEIGIAADRADFDTFWAPEHHSLEEYSHSSCSHLSCLAVGLQTENIRVVTGIFNLCPPINHPVRVAEQIATIDVLTNGRVELGTGRGSGSTEVNTFGVDADETRAMWEESIRAIPKMWTQELFSWDGKYFSVPERTILPKPVQQPHPPLWVTASNPPTVEIAARMGLGVAMFNFADPALLAPLVDTYKSTIQHAEPVGAFTNDKIMTIAPAFCLPDGDEARGMWGGSAESISAHFSVYFDTIPANAAKIAHVPRPISQTKLRQLIQQAEGDPERQGPLAMGSKEPEFLHQNGICVGSAEEVKATIQRFADIGLDQLVLIPATGQNVPHGENVLPAFR